MNAPKTASIIISNYNYARYLGVAIDSALNQTYRQTEVIVVDDGSRDHSAEVIASYGSRIKSIIKENGGQGSAFNAGFRLSRGEFIIFLDADDSLLPDTLEKAVGLFDGEKVAKVHWNLWIADEAGNTGEAVVRSGLSEGNLRDVVLRAGADGYTWPPTSGNAWARFFIEKAFPVPEVEFNTCPDLYLAALAPLYGEVRRLECPQGFWRHHPANASFSDEFEENLRGGLRRANSMVQSFASHARSLGLPFAADELRRNSRWHQMNAAVDQIKSIVPEDAALILVDEEHWKTGERFIGRRRFHFPEREGKFWGCPADDEAAINEVERLRLRGAQFIVFVWPYLWWLDHFSGLNRYLRSTYPLRADDDRMIAFDLQSNR